VAFGLKTTWLIKLAFDKGLALALYQKYYEKKNKKTNNQRDAKGLANSF